MGAHCAYITLKLPTQITIWSVVLRFVTMMRPSKKKSRGNLKILSKKVGVEAPKGFHWMEEKGRYYLMKGDYAPHPGAVKKAMFNLSHHEKG